MRFVASGKSSLIIISERGMSIRMNFFDDRIHYCIQIPGAVSKKAIQLVESSVALRDLRGFTNVVGSDGGGIITAALARHLIDVSGAYRLPRVTIPGISNKMPRRTDARILVACVCAFCKVKFLHFSLPLSMATLSNNISMVFTRRYVLFDLERCTRRVNLPSGAVFVKESNGIYTSSDAPRFNVDIVLTNLAHTLYSLI